MVNGAVIPLAAYEAHFARFQAAEAEAGMNMATEEAARIVLDDLISQMLLAQAAVERGFEMDRALLDARLESLLAEIGGEAALAAWQAENGYTIETFEQDLAQAIAAAWMRDQVVAMVPEAVEQVHARQILLYNSEDAQDIYDQLESGADFGKLAQGFDPQRLGDLGWFPRGFLVEPALEAAAFALEEGEISPVIETRLGYHILQVLAVDSARPLDSQARLILQRAALEAWLDDNRRVSEIEIFIENYR
jgi:peptidyl-prolyl cis-trans isomerase C